MTMPTRATATARLHRKSFVRAATAVALARLSKNETAERIAARIWPDDPAALQVVKAAVSPASTTAQAAALAGSAVVEFVRGLIIESAAARLFDAALLVDLRGINTASIPRTTSFPQPVFVAEGAPAPVGQGVFANSSLGPVCKMLVIVALTNELEAYSAESAEAIMSTALNESAGKALDAAVFSATAATAGLRPAGLLNGVTPITATAGGGTAALSGDLRAIVGAIADAGGGNNIWIFANPRQAVALSLLASPAFDMPVVPVPALANGTIVGIEVGAIASGFRGVPTIDTSKEAALHFEDTAPLQIATGAQGAGVLATPTRSLWQTDSMALRLRLPCAWTTRAPSMVQVINTVTW